MSLTFLNKFGKSRSARLWAVAALGVALAGGGLAAHGFAGARTATPSPRAVAPTVRAVPQTPPVVASYASVVNRVAPSVVTVRVDERAQPAAESPFFNDPFFRQFLPDRPGERPRAYRGEEALGSGVIVRPDGYILTNEHVIDHARSIKVILHDRRTFDAHVVGSDKPSDLAVLKIDATGLPALPLANSSDVRVGDIVLAVGDPLGVGQSVTMGIISAKGRVTSAGNGSYEDFLQTDAPINRGNSGGALVNTAGQLVGINSQILSPSGGSIGIGFAIPSNMARNVMTQLIDTGHVRRGLLGVTVQDVTADLASSLGMPAVKGAIIDKVEPNGAGAGAGLEQGDVITSFNGHPVPDGNALRNQVAGTLPGTHVTIGYLRNGRARTADATLQALNGDNGRARSTSTAGHSANDGLTVAPLDARRAARLGLSADAQGVVVESVNPSGPAAEAGLRPGDVIEQVNRRPVRTPDELRRALRQSGKRPALVLVERQGTPFYATIN